MTIKPWGLSLEFTLQRLLKTISWPQSFVMACTIFLISTLLEQICRSRWKIFSKFLLLLFNKEIQDNFEAVQFREYWLCFQVPICLALIINRAAGIKEERCSEWCWCGLLIVWATVEICSTGCICTISFIFLSMTPFYIYVHFFSL